MKGIIGKKIGMTQLFKDSGEMVPVTVISAGPCVVTQKKTSSNDGYNAVQMGFEKVAEKKINSPLKGHLQKNKIEPLKYLREVKVSNIDEYNIGQLIKVDIFKPGELVDIIGVSKGKGFAGGMKRHGFSGGPSSHGSMSHRRPASAGSTDSARTFKGKRSPGHMGDARKTALALEVVKVDSDNNLLVVQGSVPGSKDGLVLVRQSIKKVKIKKEKPKSKEKEKEKKK